eukprot:TRINITY_DN60020_c0_g2_i1.p1 TRINITY_DN60020_c0_g2~~TRINITY_DN60020_c0_g2_i1.p1  ORF type:complete len:724 (+),score=68.22 TRINITY_DN60020_c0_g2_i1:41-2212(+)
MRFVKSSSDSADTTDDKAAEPLNVAIKKEWDREAVSGHVGLGYDTYEGIEKQKHQWDMDETWDVKQTATMEMTGSDGSFSWPDICALQLRSEKIELPNDAFCKEGIVDEMLKCKSKFDRIPPAEFKTARNAANPWETVGTGIFFNRAGLKLMEIDQLCGITTSKLIKEEQRCLYAGDICAGPGSWTEYLLWRVYSRVEQNYETTTKPQEPTSSSSSVGTDLLGASSSSSTFDFQNPLSSGCPTSVSTLGWTLKSSDPGDRSLQWKIRCFEPISKENINEDEFAFWGPAGDGDVTKPENQNAWAEKIKQRTNGRGLSIITADGGMGVDGAWNEQEIITKRIVLCEVLAALRTIRQGGWFVCKLFDLYSEFTIGLLYILWTSFAEVALVKPFSSRPANSEKYIVCKNKLLPPTFSPPPTVDDPTDDDQDVSLAEKIRKSWKDGNICTYLHLVNINLQHTVKFGDLKEGTYKDQVAHNEQLQEKLTAQGDIAGVVVREAIEKNERFKRWLTNANNKFCTDQVEHLKRIVKYIEDPSGPTAHQLVVAQRYCHHYAMPLPLQDEQKKWDRSDYRGGGGRGSYSTPWDSRDRDGRRNSRKRSPSPPWGGDKRRRYSASERDVKKANAYHVNDHARYPVEMEWRDSYYLGDRFLLMTNGGRIFDKTANTQEGQFNTRSRYQRTLSRIFTEQFNRTNQPRADSRERTPIDMDDDDAAESNSANVEEAGGPN